jgi:hypothetical protein
MKKPLAHVLLLLLIAFLPTTKQVLAQSKITASTAVWPELQVSFGVGESSLFFFQNQYRINTDSRFNDFKDTGLLSNFERIQVSLGYQYTFTNYWRGGMLWRYAAEDFPSTSFYTLFIRHSGTIKKLFLNKQFLVEYVNQEGQEATGRYRLMAELGKRFPIKNTYLTPSLSYEAAIFTNFRQESSLSQERFIDRTRLRLNITYEVNPKLRVTPYFMRQTDYYYVEIPPVYDENDMLVENGYRTKRNRISPVIGVELKYTINRELPTASFSY